MIALDTNLLVYAHRADSEWHDAALRIVLGLAEGNQRWAIPWPCVHEFTAIATHPRIYKKPSTPVEALAAMEAWMASPVLEFLHEGPAYWEVFQRLIQGGQIRGPMVHDARIAAICIANGVTAIWSSDRDFSRFKGLKVINPLLI